jgi:uncharacterized membrane protein YgcG
MDRGGARRVALLASAVCVALLSLVAPAGAKVTEVGATKVGLQPREIARYWEGTRKWFGDKSLRTEPNVAALTFNNASGAPVLHNVATYAIYWDPQYYYHDDWQSLVDNFLANMGRAGTQLGDVFAVDAQYSDATNHPAANRSAFLGAYNDYTAYPGPEAGCVDPNPFVFGTAPLYEATTAVCLTDAQIQRELTDFVGEHNLHKGMETIFYLLTPPGVAVCVAPGHCSEFEGSITAIESDEAEKAAKEAKKEAYVEPPELISYKNSFCSYHNAIGSGDANTILYAAIPWTAGGNGDYHLAFADETPAYDCQDGAFAPPVEPEGELEEKEVEKNPTPKELEKPHDEEPNQIIGRTGPDGSYDTGLADLIVNQIAVEQQNTVTDPLLDAWHDEAGSEVTDECRNSFFLTTSGSATMVPESRAGTLANQSLGSKRYYLNDAFDLAALQLPYPGVQCRVGITLEPSFTVPNPVNAGEIVGFNGMESEITLNAADKFGGPKGEELTYPTYKWNFGDGTPEISGYAPGASAQNPPETSLCEAPWLAPCAGSVFHSYEYGGTYQVTLTVTDTGGNSASVTEPITIVGPERPVEEGGGGGGGTTGGGTTGGGSGGGGATPGTATPGSATTPAATAPSSKTTPAAPGPVATAAAVSSSIKQVARRGLVVRYAVNEQVAGRFEVLIPATVAHALGIEGQAASGLPAGYPQSVVIGQALLVTTKGGHGAVRIKFSKRTTKRLRHTRTVTLTLRLKVRNASQSPLFTTVLSTATLHR